MKIFHSRKVNDKEHICNLVPDTTSYTFLPKISRKACCLLRLFRAFRSSILISENNPQTYNFYRSKAQIYKIRQDQALSKSLMIHPFSSFQAKYELWMTFVYFVVLFYLPMEAAFDMYQGHIRDTKPGADHDFDFEPHTFRPFISIIKMILFINIIMTFRTGRAMEYKGKVIMKPITIAKKYICSMNFYIDFLTAIPEYYLVESHKYQRLINILGILIIFRLSTFFAYFTRSVEFLQLKSQKLIFAKYFIVNCVIIHWFACIQYLVPQISYFTDGRFLVESWIIQSDVPNMIFFEKYLSCLYRAIGNLLCLIFEEGVVVTQSEEVMAIVTYIVGKVYVTYISVLILHYILSLRSLEVKYYETISEVKAYMSQKHLPMHMQARVLQFYKYKYNKRFFKDHSTLGLLSEKLKSEINLNICSNLVNNVQILSHLPGNILEQVVAFMKPEIVLPNDIIIKAGSAGDCMYFLASGTVAVWTPSGKEVCHLQDGAYFGEISLIFKEKRRTANIMALEICEIYKLDRRAFKNCFKKDTALYKILENVAIERLGVTKMFEEVHARTFMESNV